MKLPFKYAAERPYPPDPHFVGVAFGESATDCPPDIPLLLVAFGD